MKRAIITLSVVFSLLSILVSVSLAAAAPEEVQATGSITSVFYEGFEGAFPGTAWWVEDTNASSGADYWDDVSYTAYAGSWSGWCAAVGTNSANGEVTNYSIHRYDNDMDACLNEQTPVDMTAWDFAYVDFYAWSNMESGFDYMEPRWFNSSTWAFEDDYSQHFTGTSDWMRYYWKMPYNYMTDSAAFSFKFHSDSSVISGGVYLDEINLMQADVTINSWYWSTSAIAPGDTLTLYYYIHNPAPFSVQCGLGAVIDAGAGYINDTAHDDVITVPSGYSLQDRSFTVPDWTPDAVYDIWFSLWSGVPGDLTNGNRVWDTDYALDALTVDGTAPPVPTLLTPVSGTITTDSTPTLDWSDVTDPSGVDYWLSLDDNADWSSPIVNGSVAGSQYTPPSALADGRYYWRVTVRDELWNWGEWTPTWYFDVDTTAPAAPTLLSPASGALINDNTPTFDWSDVTDPSGIWRYYIQVDNDADFSSIVLGDTPIASLYTAPSALSDGRYYWRVVAIDGAGHWSPWSSVWYFDLDTVAPAVPTLLSPADASETNDNTPTLDWTDVTDPSGVYYWIQFDNDSDFSSPFANGYTGSSQYTYPSALADGRYYWKIRSGDHALNWGSYTSPWYFDVDTVAPGVPTLLSPANAAKINDNTPTLLWSGVTDPSGVGYRLMVDNDADFSSPLANVVLPYPNATFGYVLADGRYYWRVRAEDGASNLGGWTPTWCFDVDTVTPAVPALVTPTNGKITKDNTPWLDWSDVSDASGVVYDLQVDNNADFSSPVFSKTGLTTSSRTVSPALAEGTYYWRVRVVDGVGNMSAWTSAWSFTIDTIIPSTPTLLYPANGRITRDNTPWLDWSDVSDATGVRYQLQVDNNADFSSPVLNKTGITASSRTLSTLADGTYYWRVRAVDGSGNSSAWTAAWSFTVDTVTPSVPTLIYPANGTVTTDTTPWLDWSDVADATGVTYRLQVDNNADFSSPVVNKSGLTLSSRTLSTLSAGTYYWRVRVTDGAGNTSAWTAAWSFTVL